MKLSQIALAVNARLENGSPDFEITGVNGIEQAEPGEITFVSNPKYAARARNTKASAVIVAEDFPPIPAGRKPDVERVDKQINFASTVEAFPCTKLVDNFYVNWTGVIRIPKDGNYTFYLESDDGSR